MRVNKRRGGRLALESCGVNRVSVKDRGAVLTGVLGSLVKQRNCDACTAVLWADQDAGHPPGSFLLVEKTL